MRARPDEDHSLLCDLDATEIKLKGEQLAEAVESLRQAEQDKADANAQFKLRIDKAKQTTLDLRGEILSKAERRTVICRWYLETDSKGQEVWELRRTDTGKLMQTQPVTAADRQLELLQGGAN